MPGSLASHIRAIFGLTGPEYLQGVAHGFDRPKLYSFSLSHRTGILYASYSDGVSLKITPNNITGASQAAWVSRRQSSGNPSNLTVSRMLTMIRSAIMPSSVGVGVGIRLRTRHMAKHCPADWIGRLGNVVRCEGSTHY